MITLAAICEALQNSRLDAAVWIEAGYIFLSKDGRVYRLSLDTRSPNDRA